MSLAEIIPLSVGENAYRRVRDDILFGRIAPGARLTLERMRADYGVGIGTLREILSRLAAESLVLSEAQRGFEAPPVTPAELAAAHSHGEHDEIASESHEPAQVGGGHHLVEPEGETTTDGRNTQV